MSVTFEAMQKQFYEVWDTQHVLPDSVTISEADYDAFSLSVFPPREWTDFERELLGDARITEMELARRRGDIGGVINYVNAGMVRLIRDDSLPSGTISLGYQAHDFEVE